MGCNASSDVHIDNFSPEPKPRSRRSVSRPDYFYKVTLMGNVNVGKSTIFNKFLGNEVKTSEYSMSIGFSYQQKSVTLADGTNVVLEVWDTIGSVENRELVAVFNSLTRAAILVFDYSSKSSLEGVRFWLKEITPRVQANELLMVVVGNKSDLKGTKQQEVSEEDVKAVLEEFEMEDCPVLELKAITGENVQDLFSKVASDCYANFR